MLKIWRLPHSGALILFATLATQYAVAADERVSVLIKDISVLEPSAAGWLSHRDIVIRDTTISAIQPTGRRRVSRRSLDARPSQSVVVEVARGAMRSR